MRTAMLMVTAELRYECITHRFQIDQCRIKELFSDYICNLVKHIRSTSPDMKLIAEELYNPSLEEIILNIVADRPESSTRAVAHRVDVGHQTDCRVLNKSHLHASHFQQIQALNLADYPFCLNLCQWLMQQCALQ